MPKVSITVSDDNDVEFELEVTGIPTPAEPDVGIMRGGLEIEDVRCTAITFYCGSEHKTISPVDGPEWIGNWCLETFGDTIHEKVAEALDGYYSEED